MSRPPASVSPRSAAVRAAAAAAVLFWTVPFFGLIDLATIVAPGEFLPLVALEASWGAFFTAIVAGPFVAVVLRPRDRSAPAVQLLLAAGALVAGALLGGRSEPLAVAALVAVLGGLLLVGTRWPAPRLRPALRRRSVPLLVVAALGAPFWAGYSWQAASASRIGLDDDITVGVPHWAVQVAAGLAVAACALVAAAWPHGRALLASSAGLAAVLLGVATAAYPASTGAMPSAGLGVAAVAWGLVDVVLGWVPRLDAEMP